MKRSREGNFVVIKVDGINCCVSLEALDVLCNQSHGFAWLLRGHPDMKQKKHPDLEELLASFDIRAREWYILLHWAEQRAFSKNDDQLSASVGSGSLRETVTALGGGFHEMLDAAERAVKRFPLEPNEDLNGEYEWKVVAARDEAESEERGWVLASKVNREYMYDQCYHFRRPKRGKSSIGTMTHT